MDENHLHILWTNADPTVFDKMVLMYAVNSLVRGWWEKEPNVRFAYEVDSAAAVRQWMDDIIRYDHRQ